MTRTSYTPQITKKTPHSERENSNAGGDHATLAPPSYGIDIVDRRDREILDGFYSVSKLALPESVEVEPNPSELTSENRFAASERTNGFIAAERTATSMERSTASSVTKLLPAGSEVQTPNADVEQPSTAYELPSSDPVARAQVVETAIEQTQETAESGKPAFMRSVELVPASNGTQATGASTDAAQAISSATQQTADLENAQKAAQASTLAEADTASEELLQTAQQVETADPVGAETEVEAVAAEAGQEGGIAAEGGDGAQPTADQAFTMLSTAMLDATTLSSTSVTFAPRPEENARDFQQASRGRERRLDTEALASTFLASNAIHVQNLVTLGLSVPTRITAAADRAKGLIDVAVAQNIANVNTHFAAVRAQAEEEADSAIKNLTSHRHGVLASIADATDGARRQVDTTYTQTSDKLDALEKNQITAVDALYTTWAPQLRAVGTEVGNEAMTTGQRRASAWLAQRNGESSLLSGPVHDNKLNARADAAMKVATEYKTSLEQEADKQVNQLLAGKPGVLESVSTAAGQAREAINNHYQAIHTSLTSAQENASTQAEKTTDRLVKSIKDSLASTVAFLGQQESTEVGRLTEYGERQKMTIDQDADVAIQSLATGVNQASTEFNSTLYDFLDGALETAAPNRADLEPVLAEVQPQTDTLAADVLQQLTEGIQQSEAGIIGGGDRSVEALHKLGESARQQATAAASSYTTRLGTLREQGRQGLNQLRRGHTKTTTSIADTAQKGFRQATQSLTDTFSTLSQKAQANLSNSQGELRKNLRGALTDLDAKINKYADEAASKVQPRWKKVLKVVLIIVVVVAVALITIASAGSLGPIGVIVLGATLGGLAGGAIQIGNNLIDGKKWHDGVATAVITGAIGGAFGGLGGVLVKGVASAGLKLAVEVGVDVIGSVVGELAVGNPLTLEGILVGAAIGAGIGGGLAGLSALRGKIKIKPTVDTPAPMVGKHLEPPSTIVRVPDVHGTPTPRQPAVEPSTPRRPQAEVERPPRTPEEAGRRIANEVTEESADATRRARQGRPDPADPDAPRQPRDAEARSKQRAGREAAEDTTDQAARKAAELPTALAAARTIAETNDAVDAPIPVVLAQLNVLKRRFRWIRSFKARPKAVPGRFSIHMIASDEVVKEIYTTSEAELQRRLLGLETPSKQDVTKAMIQESEAIGVEGGRAAAKAEGIHIDDSFEPPQSKKGDFGQGIDDIGFSGKDIFIIEHKGGVGSKLGTTKRGIQMGDDWVGTKIAELAVIGERKRAAQLLKAVRNGNLKGIVYKTVDASQEAGQRLNAKQLQKRLPKQTTDPDGTIIYNADKVAKKYLEQVKFLRGELRKTTDFSGKTSPEARMKARELIAKLL